MPSPFPGMDPYIEDPRYFPAFHTGMISYSVAALNRILPPGYAAMSDERLVLKEEDDDDAKPRATRIPVLSVMREPWRNRESSGGTALADPPLIIRSISDDVIERFIQIIVPQEREKRVVTTIEILSPTNKAAGSNNRKAYVDKQQELLRSPSHLMEIDLLRGGKHTIAAPRSRVPVYPGRHGAVCLHRMGEVSCEVWPVSMMARLPRVAVPLAGEDPDVVLDLGEVFARCYEESGLSRTMKYDGLPPGEFSDEERSWIEERIATVRAGSPPGRTA